MCCWVTLKLFLIKKVFLMTTKILICIILFFVSNGNFTTEDVKID